MEIEKEIFKRCIILYDKLIPFGFKEVNGNYEIEKEILDKSFLIKVQITKNGEVLGKIYDLEFNMEYVNFRIEKQTGNFVQKVREEFIKFLEYIRDNCTTKTYFMSNQANRITDLIKKEYNDNPEFLWENEPHGVFRNPRNLKWYGIIMNINKDRIDNKSGEVEILNVKLDKEEIKNLIPKKGFYKAYHMNKENWITIILDDTLKDEEIIKYIKESHAYTTGVNEWIIPANPSYYDVINCFNNDDTINWKQSNNINVHDIVYLYVARPYSAILYKCEVVETNIPYHYSDDNLTISKVMRIKLLKRFKEDEFTFPFLKQYGVNAIRGSRSMPKELSKVINKKIMCQIM